MQPIQSDSFLSLEAYQQLEEETDQRYEYHDGEAFAMAGGDPVHNVISVNAIIALGKRLGDSGCTIFNSDQKVRIASMNRSLYPDVSVVCEAVARSDEDQRAITNPIVLIEVLSDSTASYDQGSKFKLYSKLPSLRDYVLISQHEPLVQTYQRTSATGLWQMAWVEEPDQEVLFQSLDVRIPLHEFYLKTQGL